LEIHPTTKRHISAFLLLVCGLIFMTSCTEERKREVPKVKNGVIDLRDWDFATDGSVELSGDWAFWWKTFVDGRDENPPSPDGFIPVPKTWGGRARPGHSHEILSSQGYATYALEIILPKTRREPLALWMLDAYSAQALEIVDDNGLYIQMQQGVPGRDTASEIPRYDSVVRGFESSDDRIRITWKISNFHHARGGARKSLELGYEASIRRSLLLNKLMSVGLVVLLLTMAFYLFGLVTQRTDDHATLCFGLTLFITAIWHFLNSHILQIWYTTPSQLFHEWTNSFEYVAIYLILAAHTAFINAIAPRPWFRRFTQIILLISFCYCLVPLTRPLIVYSALHVFHRWLDLIASFVVLGHLIIESIKGTKEARFTLVGYAPFAATRIHDIGKVIGIIQGTPFVTAHGLVFLVLVQSHVMARFFAATFKSNEMLSRRLQDEVNRQTEAIRVQQNELMKAHQDLKDADEQKTRFFRTISHELRTPLTLIIGTLADSDDISRLRRSIDIASRNARRLYRLVNQLLDFQKIAISKISLRSEVVNLESFVRGMEQYVTESCRNLGYSFELSIQPNVSKGFYVQAQMDALEKILFNYFGNALKFTPKGGKISIRLEVLENFVRVTVKDTGCGISRDQQDRLFRLFVQIEGPHQQHKQGTGLGLALVKELVELMQGRVGVDSEEGKGSSFWFEIPRVEPDSKEVSTQSAPQNLTEKVLPFKNWQLGDVDTVDQSVATLDSLDDQSRVAKGRVLVVDDVNDIRSILQDMLEAAGYSVFHAYDGRHALERLEDLKISIDLIITDWMMPNMSGTELIESLHKSPKLASIPTILLTAKSDETSRSTGLKVGASAYLSKPFDQMELLSVIDNLLDLKKREREVVALNRFINENVLQRFLPPDLVKDLVDGKAIFDDAARIQPITVLFADLCGFTSSTERLGPAKIARILNSFLVRMTDVIFEEGGTIDKFIGDGILVFFGAPTLMPTQTQIERAARCALRMQEELVALNAQWLEVERHSFQMRIGLHHGPAIVGSFGGKRRSDYTAIGHTVNLASRIESQAQPGQILMSSAVRDYLAEDVWESAGSFKLKGVVHEIMLYRLLPDQKRSAA
jgi:signal transduction histidine kinase/class 3 adenylate cyclase/CheY-like chemotaxis protein